MNYHFFSDSEYAGPSPYHILRFWDSGGYPLRTLPRKTLPLFRIPNSDRFIKCEFAKTEDASEITRFWNTCYLGQDWHFNCNSKDILRWLKSGFILIIKHESEIIGTFVCHILNGVFCGKFNKQAALLDGLVVSPRYRKQGLASYLLLSMDYHIYRKPELSQALLLWLREHDSRINALGQTPIGIFDYSYAKIHELPRRKLQRATSIDKTNASAIVKSIYENTKSQFTILLDFTEDQDVYWYLYLNTIVGIADTHRVGRGDLPIWEVVFAANLHEPYFEDLQISIEQAAKELPCSNGLIFATSSKSRGNISRPSSPWYYGNSGCLTMHIYNWMPPTFLTGDILFPLSCI